MKLKIIDKGLYLTNEQIVEMILNDEFIEVEGSSVSSLLNTFIMISEKTNIMSYSLGEEILDGQQKETYCFTPKVNMKISSGSSFHINITLKHGKTYKYMVHDI